LRFCGVASQSSSSDAVRHEEAARLACGAAPCPCRLVEQLQSVRGAWTHLRPSRLLHWHRHPVRRSFALLRHRLCLRAALLLHGGGLHLRAEEPVPGPRGDVRGPAGLRALAAGRAANPAAAHALSAACVAFADAGSAARAAGAGARSPTPGRARPGHHAEPTASAGAPTAAQRGAAPAQHAVGVAGACGGERDAPPA